MRALLTTKRWLTQAREHELVAEAEAVAAELRVVMNDEPEVDPEDLFRYVYAERTAPLQQQWELLADELSRTERAS
jgi:pyruvate dehydrogenase E1 component alpha subunit